MRNVNISGKFIGSLLVVRKIETVWTANGRQVGCYECKCVCGNFINRTSKQLRQNRSKTCETCAPKRGRPCKKK